MTQISFALLMRTLFQRHTSDNVALARHDVDSFQIRSIYIIRYSRSLLRISTKRGLTALNNVSEMGPGRVINNLRANSVSAKGKTKTSKRNLSVTIACRC